MTPTPPPPALPAALSSTNHGVHPLSTLYPVSQSSWSSLLRTDTDVVDEGVSLLHDCLVPGPELFAPLPLGLYDRVKDAAFDMPLHLDNGFAASAPGFLTGSSGLAVISRSNSGAIPSEQYTNSRPAVHMLYSSGLDVPLYAAMNHPGNHNVEGGELQRHTMTMPTFAEPCPSGLGIQCCEDPRCSPSPCSDKCEDVVCTEECTEECEVVPCEDPCHLAQCCWDSTCQEDHDTQSWSSHQTLQESRPLSRTSFPEYTLTQEQNMYPSHAPLSGGIFGQVAPVYTSNDLHQGGFEDCRVDDMGHPGRPGENSYWVPPLNPQPPSMQTMSTPVPVHQDPSQLPNPTGQNLEPEGEKPPIKRRRVSRDACAVSIKRRRAPHDSSAVSNVCRWPSNGHSCGQVFEDAERLQKHVTQAHVKNCPSTVCQWADCKDKGKDFKTRAKLERHLITHTHWKPYKCGYCDGRFPTKQMKENHERTHTGEKPYRCDHDGCSYAAATCSQLRNHIKGVHEKVKDQHCRFCDFTCSDQSNLRKHEFSHLPCKPYVCPEEGCNFCENKAENFKRHLTQTKHAPHLKSDKAAWGSFLQKGKEELAKALEEFMREPNILLRRVGRKPLGREHSEATTDSDGRRGSSAGCTDVPVRDGAKRDRVERIKTRKTQVQTDLSLKNEEMETPQQEVLPSIEPRDDKNAQTLLYYQQPFQDPFKGKIEHGLDPPAYSNGSQDVKEQFDDDAHHLFESNAAMAISEAYGNSTYDAEPWDDAPLSSWAY